MNFTNEQIADGSSERGNDSPRSYSSEILNLSHISAVNSFGLPATCCVHTGAVRQRTCTEHLQGVSMVGLREHKTSSSWGDGKETYGPGLVSLGTADISG